jgi:L-ascorbate metabolism protein UlaG (beta-lactamase superfamily)
MKLNSTLILSVILTFFLNAVAWGFETDTMKTDQGNLIIHFIGHGSLMFEFNRMIIDVDPYSKLADYDSLPKADLVLVTHVHQDHFDTSALNKIHKENTLVIFTQECANTGKYNGKTVIMKNGEKQDRMGLKIEAVPAYNIINKRPNGQPFHAEGNGNGYIITFGNKRVYIAGDTENIPEMKDLGKIDIAFLPMNTPTMTPEQVADAAKMIQPKILYPYHFSNTDTSKIVELLKNSKNIEIRVRNMK